MSNPTSSQRDPHMDSPVAIRDNNPVYTYTMYPGGRGYGVLGLRQINTCRKVPLQVIFLDDYILHCLLWLLSLYALPPSNDPRPNCCCPANEFLVAIFQSRISEVTEGGGGRGRASIFDSFHQLKSAKLCLLTDRLLFARYRADKVYIYKTILYLILRI